MIDQVLLVTGAPRSGTTPLGNILAKLPGTISLYEPMGPTGDRRITMRFPMPGEPNFSRYDLHRFIADLKHLRQRFKPQRRAGHKGLSGLLAGWAATRTLWSYRLARLQPWARLLIWKDPHAVLCIPDVLDSGVRCIITLRSPYAHAASYKRLEWIANISEIYPRYAALYGDIAEFSSWMKRMGQCPFGTANLLWHLVHRRLLATLAQHHNGIYVFNLEHTADDEMKAYTRLFDWLGYAMPISVEKTIRRRSCKTGSGTPRAGKVHDFNRSAAQANSYWRSLLTEAEVAMVDEVNGALWAALSSSARV